MPLPSDLWRSPSWQGTRWRKLDKMGRRSTEAVLHHSDEEPYDIENDPAESKNLAGSPAHASVLAELRKKVEGFRRDTKDPWLRYFERIHEAPSAPAGSGSSSA